MNGNNLGQGLWFKVRCSSPELYYQTVSHTPYSIYYFVILLEWPTLDCRQHKSRLVLELSMESALVASLCRRSESKIHAGST